MTSKIKPNLQTKKLKYQSYLENFPNCPPDNFRPVDRDAFRWVHKEIIENDFLPLNLIKEPPQRKLDDSDYMCLGFGLSLFDSLRNAKDRFLGLYYSFKTTSRTIFLEDKGDHIAFLKITKDDGIADLPNHDGHFTFYVFENVSLADKILSLHPIFESHVPDKN